MQSPPGDRSRVTLSTGHEIALPLELSLAVGGVIVPARRRRLEALLPAPLSSLAIAPGVGCVALVGIQYHRVGGPSDETATATTADAGLEPYDEFAVIVPAVRGGRTTVPLAQLTDAELGGYVHWLPVTTEPSVALGREIWGYPKERIPITITDGPRGIRTVVDGGDGKQVRLEVTRPRTRKTTIDRDWALWSYTTMNGDVVRTQALLRGDLAVGTPLSTTLELGPELQTELGCWNRPLARLYGSRVRAWLFDGEAVAEA
ncbi:acetoacetate decarboxylase family protein [Natronorubrum aibiense]|uniref:Acetoacetate decarboxylase n=1 Tax=Natronorubrum aibiense TaxID=348826 RepID=A0A5P9P392_9EURY|nr:acetoacetate decarboxylase family protein [Natronorubrum aibiense]QFU82609.1 acetoacetate decarboxylase [Natronorubrum aibiense]